MCGFIPPKKNYGTANGRVIFSGYKSAFFFFLKHANIWKRKQNAAGLKSDASNKK